MDKVSVYQTVYTILFVLAGVFFAAAVVIFFLFGIRTVIGNLTGAGMRRERKAPADRGRPARARRVPAAAGPRRAKQPPQLAGDRTVIIDKQPETVVMGQKEETTAPVEVTGPADTTEPLTGTAARTAGEAAQDAMEKLGFRFGETVIVYSSDERV